MLQYCFCFYVLVFWLQSMWVLSSLTRDGTLEGEILTTVLPGKSRSLSFENVRHTDVVHIEFSVHTQNHKTSHPDWPQPTPSRIIHISPHVFLGNWILRIQTKDEKGLMLPYSDGPFIFAFLVLGSTIVPDFLKIRTTWLSMMFTESLCRCSQSPVWVKGREHSGSLEVFKRFLCPCCKEPFKTKGSGRVEDD